MINTLRPPRPLIGLGHSMGANMIVNLASMHARLLHSVVLLDPVIQRHSANDPRVRETGRQPARASTFRRDIWPSRSAAEEAFKKQKFYQQWDPRVLDRWIEFGVRDTPTLLYPDIQGGATLATSKNQEVFTFLRPLFGFKKGLYDMATRRKFPDVNLDQPQNTTPFYRPEPPLVFEKLASLRPSALYVFGELSDMSEPWAQADRIDNTGTGVGGSGGVREERVKGVTLKGVGHLVAMEDVNGCAEAIVPWIGKELKRWKEEDETWKKWRDGQTQIEKVTISEEWKKEIGGPYPRQPPKVKGKL
jgi:pimeloyl-ACP methyl ester carboxylesterase